MKIGKARFGKTGSKKYFKLTDGDSVFRILPPLGELADDGVWTRHYKVHYGYKNSEGKIRPFLSSEVKNYKTKMIEVGDAAKDRIEQVKARLEEAKEKGDAATSKKLVELLKTYNLDSKWYMNAMNLEGEIGLLKVPHKAKQQLEQEIERLASEGVDALGVENARYFVFRRTGEGFNTQYQVFVHKEKIQVDGIGTVEKEKAHTLTEDVIARLERETFNLDKLFKAPTSEEIARIVKEGVSAVDEILGVSREGTGETEEGTASDEEVESLLEQSVPAPQQAKIVPVSAASAPAPAPAQSTGGVKVGKASTATTAKAVSESPVAASNQSPEDFLKSIGLG